MKRIAVSFLCAAMIVAVLCGCGGAVPVETEETAQTTVAATEPVAETAATEETVPAETQPLAELVNDFRIAVITIDGIDRYWLNMVSGAVKAGEELGCEVVDMTPMMADSDRQAGQIRQAVSEGFDAVAVTADGSDVVAAALREAAAAGVTVICMDGNAVAEAAAVLYTDDRAAGKTAGETMITKLKEQGITEGNIAVIGINTDTDFALQREAGFREALKDSGYVLLETQYSGGDAARSHAMAEENIAQGVAGIFCCTDGSTVGVANAVKQTGAQTAVVGFGESTMIVNMVNNGDILAAMARKPATMGRESIYTACAVLHGRDPADTADMGVTVLTK